jgi:hypothetical protein
MVKITNNWHYLINPTLWFYHIFPLLSDEFNDAW